MFARSILTAVIAIVLLSFATPVRADVIISSATPNTFGTAYNLNGNFSLNSDPNIGTGSGGGFVNTSTTIPHVTVLQNGAASPGFFYYSFTTNSLSSVILDIDSNPTNTNFDTMIHLFDAAGNPLATSDDNGNDPGDGPGVIGGVFNSRIQTGPLLAGTYVVGVGRFFSSANSGGTISGSQVPTGGTFTLNVSADAAPVPEPASLAVFGFLSLTAAGYVRRRKASLVA